MGIFDIFRRKAPRDSTPKSGHVNEMIEAAAGEAPGFIEYSNWMTAMAAWMTTKSSKDLARARNSIEKAIARNRCAKHISALGQTDEMAQDYDRAADAAIQAYELDPTDNALAEWLNGHEEFLAKLGEICNPNRKDFDASRVDSLWSIIIRFTGRDSKRASAYFNRGVIRAHVLHRKGDGVEDIKKCLEITPSSQQARAMLQQLQ